MEYSGTNKTASSLSVGDFITVTVFSSDASEIESIEPISTDKVMITTANDKCGQFKTDRLIRIYK